MMKFVFYIPLIFLFHAIHISIAEDFGSCELQCGEQNLPKRLWYEMGKKYIYKFTTQIQMQMQMWYMKSSRSDMPDQFIQNIQDIDNEWFKVEGEVGVISLTSCEHILTVNYINIVKKSGHQIKMSQEHPNLRFTFEDGQIGKICLHRNDSVSSGNIKKSIVSLLQTAQSNQQNVLETDISGSCPTKYETREDGIIMKTKDLNKYRNRDDFTIFSYGIPTSENYSADLFFDSISKCNQSISTQDNVIDYVSCKETHTLTVDNTTVFVESSLQWVSNEDYTQPIDNDTKDVILSSLVMSPKQNSLKFNNVLLSKMDNITATLCQEFNSNTVTRELSKSVSEFLQIIGKMETIEDLEAIKKTIFKQNCDNEESVFKIKYLYDLAISESPNEATIEDFYNSLLQNDNNIMEQVLSDFISNIGWSQNMKVRSNLISLLKLMKVKFPGSGSLQRKFILAASQALLRYSQNVANFGTDQLIRTLLQNIEENVNLMDLMEQIKVLGNLPQISKNKSEEFDCLNWPVTDTMTKTESLYCVYAFQSDSCNPVWKNKIRNILKQTQAESDLRILAFLSAWKCLDSNDINIIESLFQDINSNSDILGFISSYIQNRLKNGNTLTENNKILSDKITLLARIINQNKMRQLSKNYAWVYFDMRKIFTCHLDLNVLFSSQSYVPSFLNGNLTIEIQGRSYNLLEFGIATNQMEAFVNKYILKKTDVAVEEEEILLFLRTLGTTIYSGKISVKNLYNSIFSTANYLLPYGKIFPLELLLEDKIIDVFHHWRHYNQKLVLPTAVGFPLEYNIQANTVVALKYQSKGLLQWSPFKNSTFTVKFAPSFVTTFSNAVTIGLQELYEIGIYRETYFSSSSDLDLSVQVSDGEPSAKIQLDFPIKRLPLFESVTNECWLENNEFSITRSPFNIRSKMNNWSGGLHNCSDLLSTILSVRFCKYFDPSYGEREYFWVDVKQDVENEMNKSVVLDLFSNLQENEKYFKIRLHSSSINNTENFDSLFVEGNYTSFSSHKVKLNISTPWMASELTVFGNHNETWQGVLTSFSYNERTFSGEVYHKVSSAWNLPYESPEIRLNFLDVFFCSFFRNKQSCDVRYEAAVKFSHPYSTKTVAVFDAMAEKVANESIINFHIKTGNVFKMAEGSLEGKFHSSANVDHPEVQDALTLLLDIDIVSVALGRLQLNNNLSYIVNNEDSTIKTSMNGKYARFHDEEFHTFYFEAIHNETLSSEEKLKSMICKFRTSQAPFLDSDLIWSTNSSSVHKITFLPVQIPSYEFQLTKSESKWKWLSYKSFDISEIVSASMPKKGWKIFLRLVSMKNAELHSMDFALDVQKKSKKYSTFLLYNSGTQLLKAAINSPKISYDLKRTFSVKTSESGSTKTLDNYVISKNPGNENFLSCMYSKEVGKADVALKYKDEKYFQYSYEDKTQDFQKNNAIFIKNFIDGNILLKTIADGSVWPIIIHIDTKWIPNKYKISGEIAATPEGSNIKLDLDVDWQLIGEESNSALGKVSGVTHVGIRTYELTSVLKINQKGEQDCFLRTNAKLIDESGKSMWKPQVQIVLKNARDDSLFDISYLFEFLQNNNRLTSTGAAPVSLEIILFHTQLKGLKLDSSLLNFNTKFSINETEGPGINTQVWTSAVLDVEHKNNFIYQLPFDLDFHLNGDWFYEDNKTSTEHLVKVKAESESGILPEKWYTWNIAYDIHPSDNPSDFDNKTKKVRAHFIKGEFILEQSDGFKRTANCKLIATKLPTKYNNYTCEYCPNSKNESGNVIFYGDDIKTTLEFTYLIDEKTPNYELVYLNGSSQFSWMMDKWTNLHFSQDHTVLMPLVSPLEESWITVFEFSTNETETNLNFGQPGLLKINGVLNQDVAKLSSSVDFPEYETSLRFRLDRNISLDNFLFDISAQSPFKKLSNISLQIDHKLNKETLNRLPLYRTIVAGRVNKDLFESELRWMPKLPGVPFITFVFLEASIKNEDSQWPSHFLDFHLTELGLHGTVASSRVYVLQSQYKVSTDSYFSANGNCSPLEFNCDLRVYVPEIGEWAVAIKTNIEVTRIYQVAIFKGLDPYLQLNVDVDHYGEDAETGVWKLVSNATLGGIGLHSIADEIKGHLNAKSRLISPTHDSEDPNREIQFEGDIVFIKISDSDIVNDSLFKNTYQIYTNFSNFDKTTSFKLCTLDNNTNQTKYCSIRI